MGTSEGLRLASKIEAVTLYHRGATVERSALLVAQDGRFAERVVFEGLPLALVDETVRVRVVGADEALEEVALAVADFRVGLSAHQESSALESPEQAALKVAGQSLLKKTILLQQIEKEQLYLSSMELPDRPEGEEGKPPPMSPMSARMALEQFTHDAVVRRSEEVQALRKEIEGLQEEVEDLRARLEQVSQSREVKAHSLFKVVEAQVRQGQTAVKQVRLILSYFVPGAQWVPTYQCRLRRDGTAAEIQMRALVSQRTGEDWERVKLSLSTANPMRWTELPELSSLRIGKAQPVSARRGFRPPPKGAIQLFGDFDHGLGAAKKLLPVPERWAPVSLYCEPLSTLTEGYAPVAAGPARSIQLNDDEDMGFMYTSQEELSAYQPPEEPMRDMAPMAKGARPSPKMKKKASAPPPPAPPMMQASMLSAPMDAMMSLSADSNSFGGGSVGMSYAMEASESVIDAYGAGEKMKERSELRKKAPRPGGRGGRDLSGSWHYSQLRLCGAEERHERGRLRPIQPQTQYLQVLQRLEVKVNIDVMAVVQEATSLALSHDAQPLPEGATDVKRAAGHFDYTYVTDAAVDVPADGHTHSIAVGSREADCRMHYVIVPREDPQAYRVAALRNPLHAPLLPGPAEIYIGGEYILSTQLPTVPPQGDLQLWLGVEQSIKCARNTRFRERRSGAKVVAMNELHHEVDIEVANRLEREIRCEVHERIPQPDQDAEIVVEEGEVAPAWEVYDQEERGRMILGGRRWQVVIPAGDKAQLRAAYTIKIYANNEIVGGNRREA